jgi:LPPG:FO 2-phospho-L-lactate transferase
MSENEGSIMRVAALAGGVGGAKLVDGLAQCLSPEDLTIIVNTGDDFDHLGLRICPDLDTVCYTLADIANQETGWGRRHESWNALASVTELGGPNWFQLGDRDLGTHLERTRRLAEGESLSGITSDFCRAWGIKYTVLPITDDDVPTWVYTEDGKITFQEYFVHRQCQPRVTGFRFENAEHAHPAPGVLESLQNAELVIICPSNPWVSIDPILAIPGVRSCIDSLPIVAVSPIIGGKAVKGPAAKMFAELGIKPSMLSVFHHYGKMLGGFVLDNIDVDQVEGIHTYGIQTLVTDTLMKTSRDRQRLAKEVLEYSEQLIN